MAPSATQIGTLICDPNEQSLGVGAFKTVHLGYLTLSPLSLHGLGRTPNERVAVKRPFFTKKGVPDDLTVSKIQIKRYNLSDELPRILTEANMLYWATSLMALTYGFIDRALQSAPAPPPFNIPSLRYVHGAVALSGSRAYLLEELLDQSEGDPFVKYVHNVSLREGLAGHDIGEFLCFCQHVQYVKTSRAAFISDFQGQLSTSSLHYYLPIP